MLALSIFKMATLEKKNSSTQKIRLPVTFSKIRLDILASLERTRFKGLLSAYRR